VSYTKKSDWAQTTLNPALASELQRIDDGVAEACSISNVASADRVNHNLVLKLNNGSTEGSDQFTFNGSQNTNINLTPNRLYGITDGSAWVVIQNSAKSPRYLTVLEYIIPDVNYRRINQSFVVSMRSETIILDVVLATATSAKFSTANVYYMPLTKNGSSIVNNLSVEISNVDSTHQQFKLWYYQPSGGPSLSIRPIARNAENVTLTGYSYNSTAASGTPGESVMDVTIQSSFPDALNPKSSLIVNGTDLNTVLVPGLYYAAGNNKCTNLPDNVDGFGLTVKRISNGYYYQELVSANTTKTTGCVFYRIYNGKTWTMWYTYYSTRNDNRILSGLWRPTTGVPSNFAQFEFGGGSYTKCDRHVHCEWVMTLKSTSPGSVSGGTIEFSGLPYPVFESSDGATTFGGCGIAISSNSEFVSTQYTGGYCNLWTITPFQGKSSFVLNDISGAPLASALIHNLQSVVSEEDIHFDCTLDYITNKT
jgi:hypothetical protein